MIKAATDTGSMMITAATNPGSVTLLVISVGMEPGSEETPVTNKGTLWQTVILIGEVMDR